MAYVCGNVDGWIGIPVKNDYYSCGEKIWLFGSGWDAMMMTM